MDLKSKKNLIFWGAILLIGAGLILYSYFEQYSNTEVVLPTVPGNPEENSTNNQKQSDATPLPFPSPTPRPLPLVPVVSTQEPFLGLNGVKSPATCQVGGEVRFISADSFLSLDSKISWQNIDSYGRLIKWDISPKDELAVGPNIFESLPLPNGEYQNLTVRLPEKPVTKNYTLTARVTYGQFVKGNLEIKETDCAGQVKVNLNF